MHRPDEQPADHDDGRLQAVIDEHVDGAMEEVSQVMRRLIEEAVQAALSEAMVQRSEGEPTDGLTVVDTEGNHLEVLSVEEGVIEVGILMEEDQDEEDEEDEEDGRRLKVGKGKKGWDGGSSK